MKTEQTYRKSVGISLIFLLIGTLMGGVVVYVLASPLANTMYFSSGKYSSGASYTIWKEASTYYAKDPYGRITYSGTDCWNVFSSAINDTVLNGYGQIFVTDGDYYIDQTLPISTAGTVEIKGETRPLIVFTGTGDGIRLVAPVGESVSLMLTDLRFLGQANITNVIHAYHGNSLKWSVFKNVKIAGSESAGQQIGIYLNDENGEGGIYFNHFQRVRFVGIDVGLKIIGHADNAPNVNTFVDTIFYMVEDYGVYMNSYPSSNRFIGMDFEDCNGTQIYTDSDSSVFKDVWIEVVSGATSPFHFDDNAESNVIEMFGHNYGTINYLNWDDGTKNRITNYAENVDFYDKRAINNDGYFQLTKITHPNVGSWTSEKDAYTWYCTTHNKIEYYYNGTVKTLTDS